MLDVDRSEQALDGEVLGADEPGCVELVPVTPSMRWMPKGPITRPDPGFVTQLIATAAQAPPTRRRPTAPVRSGATAPASGPGKPSRKFVKSPLPSSPRDGSAVVAGGASLGEPRRMNGPAGGRRPSRRASRSRG